MYNFPNKWFNVSIIFQIKGIKVCKYKSTNRIKNLNIIKLIIEFKIFSLHYFYLFNKIDKILKFWKRIIFWKNNQRNIFSSKKSFNIILRIEFRTNWADLIPLLKSCNPYQR